MARTIITIDITTTDGTEITTVGVDLDFGDWDSATVITPATTDLAGDWADSVTAGGWVTTTIIPTVASATSPAVITSHTGIRATDMGTQETMHTGCNHPPMRVCRRGC